MRITCTQCQFSQEIQPEKIPSDAAIATCPKCQSRFRFRTNSENLKDFDVQAHQEQQKSYEHQEKNTSLDKNFEDPPPGAFIPNRNKEQQPPDNRLSKLHTTQKIASLFQSKHEQNTQNFSIIPWEHPEKFSFFASFYQTITRVLFKAPVFFANIQNATSSLFRPLAFYIILKLIQTLIDGMWIMVSLRALEPSITESSVHELLNTVAHEISLPISLVITPITLAIQLTIYTALFHIMIRLVQPEKAHFVNTFRVIAYSAATAVIYIIPVIGPLIGSIWFSVSCFIGCKYALNISWNKVALALIPLYLIAIAIGIQTAQHFMQAIG